MGRLKKDTGASRPHRLSRVLSFLVLRASKMVGKRGRVSEDRSGVDDGLTGGPERLKTPPVERFCPEFPNKISFVPILETFTTTEPQTAPVATIYMPRTTPRGRGRIRCSRIAYGDLWLHL